MMMAILVKLGSPYVIRATFAGVASLHAYILSAPEGAGSFIQLIVQHFDSLSYVRIRI